MWMRAFQGLDYRLSKDKETQQIIKSMYIQGIDNTVEKIIRYTEDKEIGRNKTKQVDKAGQAVK